MKKHLPKNQYQSKLIFEELEARVLFSGGAEALLIPQITQPIATYIDVNSQLEPVPANPATPQIGNAATQNHNTAPSNDAANQVNLQQTAVHEIVFVDPKVNNYQALLDDVQQQKQNGRQIEVVLLDSSKDGIQQILDTVKNRQEISAIHLIAEGTSAQLHLGSSFLTQDSIANQYAQQLQEIGQHLSGNADLLVYGCNFGQGAAGQTAIQTLASLTGADVAASTNRTGSTGDYGDWVLEASTGPIEAANAISQQTQQSWQGALATYTVTNTSDSGVGSLRQAITDANNNAGADNISFSISGTGIHTITLATLLPDITSVVNIDATTDDSFAAQNQPAIVLNGHGAISDGLRLYSGSSGSNIRGLIIQNFTGNGINIASSDGNTIAGNWIGLNSAGTAGAGNQQGVNIWAGNNNIIGGSTASDRNAISANTNNGIYIESGATGNQIRGNYIGTNAAGDAALGNINYGIFMDSAGNTIGGADTNFRNVISGTVNVDQIHLSTSASNTTISGNYIGLNAAGTAAFTSGGAGIFGYSSNNLIGGTSAAERNVVSGGYNGIIFDGVSATGNQIIGNYVGTDYSGNTALNTIYDGVRFENGAYGNTLGGNNVNQRNIISGLGQDAVQIDANGSDGNIIKGNWIGLAANGTTVLGNGEDAILITTGAKNTVIGGSSTGDGNVIVGSVYTGVEIWGASTGTIVRGNSIGTNAAGTLSGGNNVGVFIGNGAGSNIIGGIGSNDGNSIANSVTGLSARGNGIYIDSTATTGNALLGNRVWNNAKLGINISGGSENSAFVTANDTGDSDSGANGLQNFPVLTAATASSGSTTITGNLNSNASTTFRIEFFSSPAGSQDASGYGEGRNYLGTTTVTTNSSGNASFNVLLSGITIAGNDRVTATATVYSAGSYRSTSEFAANVVATQTNTAPVFSAGTGLVTTNIRTAALDYINDAAVQADGKIVTVGYSDLAGKRDFAIARYNQDGSLDTSFGSGTGKLITSIGTGDDIAQSVKILADGKIVVIGTSYTSGFKIALVRYNTDGSLDTSFGTGGIVISNQLTTDPHIAAAMQSDGKYVVAGEDNNDFFVSRFNSDGSADTSFGSAGSTNTDFALSTDKANSVIVQPDGKIVLGGYAFNGSSFDFAMARYNSNGTLDTSFNGTGKVMTDLGSASNDTGYSVTMQSDGKLLLAGWSDAAGGNDFALVRYNNNGTLDTTFNSTGIVTTSFSSGSDLGQSVIVQPDGKILVSGISNNNGNDFGIVRYNTNGSLDTTFNSTGQVETTFSGASQDWGTVVTLDTQGKIIVAGTSTASGNYDFAIARYNNDGSLDTRFNITNPNSLDGTPSYTENGTPVVLDGNVQVFDAELSAINYNGATLTLARNGGTNVQDVFSAVAAGTLGTLTQGGNLTIGSTNFGTITTNANGTLVLTFNSSATNALVNATLQQIAYSNSSDTPPTSVQINWTFSDGNTGAQGTGGALSATGSTTVSITAVNDAPYGIALLNPTETNLISNGSFETNNGAANSVSSGTSVIVPGWTAIGGEGFEVWNNTSSGGPANASDGNTRLELDVGTALNGISQDINTTANQKYIVSFDFSSRYGATDVVEVYWSNNLIGTVSQSSIGWKTYSFMVTGTGGTDTLKFMETATTNDGLGAMFDNVRMIADQSPAISVAENSANGTVVARTVATDYETASANALTYSLTDSASGRFAIDPSSGIITVADGTLLNYEAASSQNIIVRATDSGGLSLDKTFTVNLLNVNEMPTAVANTAIALEAGGVSNGSTGNNPTGNVLSNDTDVDSGDTKTVTGIAVGTVSSASGSVASNVNGSYGFINIAADGSYTYTVDNSNAAVQALASSANTLTDTFTYTMQDAGGLASTTQITVTIQGGNDAPAASNLNTAETYTEDTTLGLTPIVVSDVDSSAITVTLSLSNAAAGSLSTGTSGLVTSTYNTSTGVWTANGAIADVNVLLSALSFTPAANFNGTLTISTSVSDGVATAITGSKTLTGVAVNDAPTINVVAPRTTNEEVIKIFSVFIGNSITISDPDAGNNALQLSVTANHGTVSLGHLTGLTFTNGDGSADTTMTFTGTLANINNALDNISYMPDVDYNGSAPLDFSLNDLGNTGTGGALTATASQSITVLPINDAPTATNLSAAQTYTEDTNLSLTPIVVSDVDNNTTTVTLTLSNSADGSLNTGTSGSVNSSYNPGTGVWTASGAIADVNILLGGLVFTPALNFNSNFTISTSVSDGALSVTGSKAMTAVSVNDTPIAVIDSATAVEAGGTSNGVAGINPSGNVLGNDTDVDTGDSKTIIGVAYGTIGSASSSVGTNVNGSYGIINIAANGLYTYAVDNNNNAVQALGSPANTLTDTFTYTMQDASGLASTTQITVTIQGANDTPVLTSASLNISEGQTVTLSPSNFAVTDPDNTSFNFTVSSVTGGYFQLASNVGAAITSFSTADLTNGLVQFVHDGNESAPSFNVVANDGLADSAVFPASINYTPVNDAPLITGASLTINQGQTVTLSAAGFAVVDPDSTDFTFTASAVSGGFFQLTTHVGVAITTFSTSDLTSGLVQFVHDDSPTAPAFNLTINDDIADSNTLAASITFTAVNHVPVNNVPDPQSVLEESKTTISGISITDPAQSSDIFATRLQAAQGILNIVLSGSVTISAGADGSSDLTMQGSVADINASLQTLFYTPNTNIIGANADSLSIITSNLTHPGIASSSLAINITNVNDPAIIGGEDTGSITEDTGVTNNFLHLSGQLTITDPDPSEAVFQPATLSGKYGILQINGSGIWTYKADNRQQEIQQLDHAQSIQDTVTVTSLDGSQHEIVITIHGTDDAPVISGDTTGKANQSSSGVISGKLTVTQIDSTGIAVNFTDVSPTVGENGYGSFSMKDNVWTYQLQSEQAQVKNLKSGETLTDSYTFIATDGSLEKITITIVGENNTILVGPSTQATQNTDTSSGLSIPKTQSIIETSHTSPITQLPASKVSDQSNPVIITDLKSHIEKLLAQLTTSHDSQQTSSGDSNVIIDLKDNVLKPKLRFIENQKLGLALAKTSSNLFEPENVDQQLDENLFKNYISQLEKQFHQTQDQATKIKPIEVEILLGSTISVTAGVVGWTLRSGALLASFLSTVPLLNRFDPLPILKSAKKLKVLAVKNPTNEEILAANPNREAESEISISDK